MDTNTKAFVEKRAQAHAAGTRDIASDPLVKAAIDAQRDAENVMTRWRRLREEASTAVYAPRAPLKAGQQAE